MKIKEMAATWAAYYMSRFNCNLGFQEADDAFKYLEKVIGMDADTIRMGMRDCFDYYFPYRAGWDLSEPDKAKLWKDYELEYVFEIGNKMSQEEIKNMLINLKLWNI